MKIWSDFLAAERGFASVWNPGFGLSLVLSAPVETWFAGIPLQPKHLRVSLE